MKSLSLFGRLPVLVPLALIGALIGLAAGAAALAPAGPPHLDVAASPGSQLVRGVAVDGQGVITLVWSQLSATGSGPLETVAMRRFSKTGGPLGPDVVLDGSDSYPGGVAANQRGDYVVIWYRAHPGGEGQDGDVLVRRAGPGLAPVVVTANGPAVYPRSSGAVAIDRNGDFVAVWSVVTPAGERVFGQRFNPDGSKRGPEFNAATNLTGSQTAPSVAMNPRTGEFVVVWTALRAGGAPRGVFGQRFGFLTGRQGSEFQVNTSPLGQRTIPQVRRAENGNFVVVWTSRRSGEFASDIRGQRFDAAGQRAGGEFAVSLATPITDGYARLGVDLKGAFVVVWDDGGPPLLARSFRRNGAPAGPERDISPLRGQMGGPEIAFGWDGRFVLGATNFYGSTPDEDWEAGFQWFVP